MIKPDRARREIGAFVLALHEAVAGEVQAQLHAAGMKAGGPVELALSKKIVPLDAVARAVKTAEERLPALAHITPRARLAERWRGGF